MPGMPGGGFPGFGGGFPGAGGAPNDQPKSEPKPKQQFDDGLD